MSDVLKQQSYKAVNKYRLLLLAHCLRVRKKLPLTKLILKFLRFNVKATNLKQAHLGNIQTKKILKSIVASLVS